MTKISKNLNSILINKLKSLLKVPSITDKSIQLLKYKKYIFYAHKNVNKNLIYHIIKFLFNLKCKKINVLNKKNNNKIKLFFKKFILTIE